MLLDLDGIFDNDQPRALRPTGLTPDDLPSRWHDLYRERAAIRELSGGLPREIAEHYALLDTLEMMRNWDKYPNY